MTEKGNARSGIPRFRSAEEEAEFWDTHSPLDYAEATTEVRNGAGQRRLGHILAVRLDAETLGKLAAIGGRMGIGPSTLARIWLKERLAAEEQHRAAPAAENR